MVNEEEFKDDEFENFIQVYAETIFNHLGFILDHQEATAKLPSDEEMKKYYGIVSWFHDNNMANAEDYAKWLTRQLNNGKKLLVLGEFGFDFNNDDTPVPDKVMDDFYKAFNIRRDPGNNTISPLLIEVVKNIPEMTEFERPLKGDPSNFTYVEAPADARVFLKLKRRDNGTVADAVFVHSKGGFVHRGFDIFQNIIDFQKRWRIDPFKFFSLAFDADFPKPDITTQNGMRLFYSHIDGDGFRNLSLVDKRTPSGAVTYEKILTQYNLPFSISVVIAEILTAGEKERKEMLETIKKIYDLPNVQAASHGWAHPFVWKKKERKTLKLRGYKYSPAAEIGASINYINENLTPPDKKTDIFFWTGDCRPDYEALKYTYDNNIRAMNGGDTRFDSFYPSYTYVSPLFRHVDDLLQYYSSSSNENTYTNLWTGPFYGYKYATETFENTESPIRLRPIDIYYHYYSMERDIAVRAVQAAYDWALLQEIAPEFEGHYIDTLTGFLTTRIEKISDNVWRVSDSNAISTVRFDDTKKHVDMARSKGVLGYLNYQGSLYVHLDNGKNSEIVLSDANSSIPYLRMASGQIKDWKRDTQKISFKQRVMGRVRFTVAGLERGHEYTVTAGETTKKITADKDGMVAFFKDIPTNRFDWMDIEIQ